MTFPAMPRFRNDAVPIETMPDVGLRLVEEPLHPGLDATYEDTTPGGLPKSAELTVNMDTLDFLIGSMHAANRQRLLNAQDHEATGRQDLALEQRARMQPYLAKLLEEARDYHQSLGEDEVKLVDETARQARLFVADGSTGKVEGLDHDDIADMEFLHTIMRGMNQHAQLDPSQPQLAQLGENKYQTVQKADLTELKVG